MSFSLFDSPGHNPGRIWGILEIQSQSDAPYQHVQAAKVALLKAARPADLLQLALAIEEPTECFRCVFQPLFIGLQPLPTNCFEQPLLNSFADEIRTRSCLKEP